MIQLNKDYNLIQIIFKKSSLVKTHQFRELPIDVSKYWPSLDSILVLFKKLHLIQYFYPNKNLKQQKKKNFKKFYTKCPHNGCSLILTRFAKKEPQQNENTIGFISSIGKIFSKAIQYIKNILELKQLSEQAGFPTGFSTSNSSSNY